jgi:hypothetical protein
VDVQASMIAKTKQHVTCRIQILIIPVKLNYILLFAITVKLDHYGT